MSNQDERPLEDPLSDLFEVYDEALGTVLALSSSREEAVADLELQLQRAKSTLDVLEHIWPSVPTEGNGLPAQIGRFQIIRELGQGGSGIVFLAFDPTLNREVALKVPRPETLVKPELRKRFLRQAQAAAGLDHPNVVPVYEVGEAGPVHYITSAYCEGPTLAIWLKEHAEPVPFRMAAALVAVLAEAIWHAHGRGVLHRDLKPSNILLERKPAAHSEEASHSGSELNFIPRITDFGLAKVVESDGDETRSGLILGTPRYMAPEQTRGRTAAIGPTADVYSLGTILYEVLTGRPPFWGETDFETLRLVQTEEPVGPRRLRLNLPRDLETITLKCLAKEPGRRYPTSAALADDLHRWLRGEPIQARPVGALGRLWRWSKRRPGVASLSAALLLLLVTLVGGSAISSVLIARQERKAIAAREEAERNATVAREERDRADGNREEAERNAALAREERDRADANAVLLREERDRANAARREADDHARRTSEQLNLALETLNQQGFDYQVLLEDMPGDPQVKTKILRMALAGLQRVTRNAAGNAADLRLALAYIQMGRIHLVLEEIEEAHRAYQQGLTMAEALVKTQPPNHPGKRNLVQAYNGLGDVNSQKEDYAAAREYYIQALQLCRAWAVANPSDTEAKRDLAVINMRLGHACIMVGDTVQAEKVYQEARNILNELARASPRTTRFQRDLAAGHMKMAELLLRWDRKAEAANYYKQARIHLEQLTAEDPLNRLAKYNLARLSEKMGFALADPQESRKYYGRAQQLLEEVTAAAPQNPPPNLALASVHYRLGQLDYQNRQYSEALSRYAKAQLIVSRFGAQESRAGETSQEHLGADVEKGIGLCRMAIRAVEDLEFALKLPAEVRVEFLLSRGLSLARRNKHLEAAETLERLRELSPRDVTDLYNIARCYALCATAASREKTSRPATTKEVARVAQARYTATALETLTQAIDQGYRDSGQLQNDPDLHTVRHEPGFQALLARIKK